MFDHQITARPIPHSSGLWLLTFGLIIALAFGVAAQSATPTPTPTPSDGGTFNGYHVTLEAEFGVRGRSIDGNINKYRSDLNYKSGFRFFDSNLLLESDSGKGRIFDSLLISNSGWGADPQGFTRVNVEKIGFYKFNANVRRITYFNNLSNHALGEHTANTKHWIGDFDMILLPQNETIRFNLGASFASQKGPGFTTARAYSDEFPISSNTRNNTDDFRVGVEGKLLGFNFGLTQGLRIFKDKTSYVLTAPNAGNNPANTAALATFTRDFPTEGHSWYTQFNAQRTFAKKFDFTTRFIYSSTNTDVAFFERITGRDNSNNFVDLDRFNISARSKRIQTRGDIGLTYQITDQFRLSNTFSFDRFTINGGEAFEEALFRRNAAGNPLATTTTRTAGYRVTNFRRYTNTAEGDYQVNNNFGFHLGYRYTSRRVEGMGYDVTYTSAASATNPAFISETENNSTNAVIGGLKVKPRSNWVIYADIEHGSADNVFTRLENYKYTNFRVRSRVTLSTLALNFSIVTKDNSNPSNSIVIPATIDFTTNVKSRFYSGTFDWTARPNLTISGGYTYRHLTSYTPIILPVGGVFFTGSSQYFSRDNYGYLDLAWRANKYVALYAAYRISLDHGQGDRFSNVIQNIITSYPMQFTSPEARVAFRLHRHVDWNIGYQYYNYHDSQTPFQNYAAHLPYTSLRIFWGKSAVDR